MSELLSCRRGTPSFFALKLIRAGEARPLSSRRSDLGPSPTCGVVRSTFGVSSPPPCTDVRHGPAHVSTAPPAKPRRSVETRSGRRARSMSTRAGTGCRQRRRTDTGTESGLGERGSGLEIGIRARGSGIRTYGMLDRKRRHRKRTRTMRVHERRRADTVLAHERAQAREQGGQLFGRGMRTRKQRVLQNRPRCRLDDDGDPVDGGRRRMRSRIEQRQRAQRADIAQRRRQFEPARMHLARDEAECTCSTAAPRSRRSSRVDNGSSSRVSTNDSGSAASIGHSSSSVPRSVPPPASGRAAGRPRRGRSPARRVRHAPAAPTGRPQEARRVRRAFSSPSASTPQWPAALRPRAGAPALRCRWPAADPRAAARARRGKSDASASADSAGADDREPRTRERQHQRRHARRRNRHVDAHAARRRLAPHFGADRLGVPNSRDRPRTSIDTRSARCCS